MQPPGYTGRERSKSSSRDPSSTGTHACVHTQRDTHGHTSAQTGVGTHAHIYIYIFTQAHLNT